MDNARCRSAVRKTIFAKKKVKENGAAGPKRKSELCNQNNRTTTQLLFYVLKPLKNSIIFLNKKRGREKCNRQGQTEPIFGRIRDKVNGFDNDRHFKTSTFLFVLQKIMLLLVNIQKVINKKTIKKKAPRDQRFWYHSPTSLFKSLMLIANYVRLVPYIKRCSKTSIISVIFNMLQNILVLLLAALSVNGELSLPSSFQRCKRSDANFHSCLRSAIEAALPVLGKGLPEFKFDSIEPIKIPALSVGAGTGVVHVDQHYENAELHNFHIASVKDVKAVITDTDFAMDIEMFLNNCHLEAEYSLDGNIMAFKIFGKGTTTIELRNATFIVRLSGKMFTKKDKKYIEITETSTMLQPGFIEMDFRNLFDGDQNLGKQMNTLLNDNWKEVYADVQHGYEEALAGIVKLYANLIFKRVPVDEIFLP